GWPGLGIVTPGRDVHRRPQEPSMTAVPRAVTAAPSSGHGTTAAAVGLLAALRARGLHPTGFKIAPDYADAAFLALAAWRPGRIRPARRPAARGARRRRGTGSRCAAPARAAARRAARPCRGRASGGAPQRHRDPGGTAAGRGAGRRGRPGPAAGPGPVGTGPG